MRSKRNWLSGVAPVGMTSLMSRSRSVTRTAASRVAGGAARPGGGWETPQNRPPA
jgi:hypothetical protein